MYKILIVDDRIDVVMGMIELLDWNGLGCEVAGYATNGEQAFELIQSVIPDIIITDIKMPLMDGLELIELCRKTQQNLHYIVLSGYDDFSFAQRAIRLGVEEYILKPGRVEDISSAISRIVGHLNQMRDKMMQISSMKRQLIQSLPLLKNEYFYFLVSAQSKLRLNDIKEQFDFLNIQIPLQNLVVLVIELDKYMELEKQFGHGVTGSFGFAVMNGAEEFFSRYYLCEPFRYGGDKTALFLHDKEDNPIDEGGLMNQMAEFSSRMQEGLNLSLTMGVSNPIETILDIREGFSQALQALSYKMHFGHNKIFCYRQISDFSIQEKIDYSDVEELIHAMRIGETNHIKQLVDGFFHKNSRLRPKQLKNSVQEIATLVVYYVENMNVSEEAKISVDFSDDFPGIQTAEELKKWLINLFAEIDRRLQGNKTNQIQSYVANVKNILEYKYAGNITLTAVSELIGLTPAYLSAIFKEETKTTFTDYLTEVRMKKAKELLASGKYKIYEVTQMVGYTDTRYFSEVFKKKMGFNPKDFVKR